MDMVTTILIVLCLLRMTHQAITADRDLLVLFKDVMKLARIGKEQQCPGSTSFWDVRPANDDKIVQLIQYVEEMIESELSTSRRTKRFVRKRLPYVATRKAVAYRRHIALPPGTRMSLTPTLQLPFIRDLPDGVDSFVTLSFPTTSNLMFPV